MQIRPLFLESEYKFWIFSSAYESMKTPERLRPSCIVPSLSLFLAKDVNWRHDVTWHYVTWESEPASVNPSENPKINLATLTFDLWPPNPFQILSRSNSPPVVRQTVQLRECWQTDTHTCTHGTDFIPSIVDAGGKRLWIQIRIGFAHHIYTSCIEHWIIPLRCAYIFTTSTVFLNRPIVEFSYEDRELLKRDFYE